MRKNTPKQLATFISNSSNAGLIVITASTLAMFGLPVMWISGVVTSYYALEKILSAFFLVFLIALVPSIIAFFVLDDGLSSQILWQMVLFMSILGILSYILRTTRSWSIVMQAMGLIGALFVICVYWIYPDIEAMWVAHLKTFFTTTELSDNALDIARFAQYATGMQAAILCCSAAFNLLIARYWQACVYRKKQKVRAECLCMQLSYLSLIVMTGLGLCMFWGFLWALDAFIVALLPAFFVGCAVFHSYCEKRFKKSNRVFFLIAFYVTNMVVFPLVPLFVTTIGVIDTLFPVRQHLSLISK